VWLALAQDLTVQMLAHCFFGHDIFVVVYIDVLALFITVPHF